MTSIPPTPAALLIHVAFCRLGSKCWTRDCEEGIRLHSNWLAYRHCVRAANGLTPIDDGPRTNRPPISK